MKKRLVLPLAAVAIVAVPGVAFAVVGTPEVDNANANIALQPSAAFRPTTCAGEDGISYITYRGTWKGSESDVTPGSTDYSLSGPLKVSGVTWTINTKTQRGVLKGTATLTSAAANLPTYSGLLVLITQGMPVVGAKTVLARGWINAATSTNGAADGGSILANVEFRINGGFNATGIFGDAAGAGGTANYSVAFNNKTC
jgi:hypothetical protein